MDTLAVELKMVGILLLCITLFVALLSVSTFGLKSRDFGAKYFVWSTALLVVSATTMFLILISNLAQQSLSLYLLATLLVNGSFLGTLYGFYRGIEKNFERPVHTPRASLLHRMAQGSLVLMSLWGSTTPITVTAAAYYILFSLYMMGLLQTQPLRASRVSRLHLNGVFLTIILLNVFRFVQMSQPREASSTEAAYWISLIVICLISIAGIMVFAFFVFDSQIQLVNTLKNQLQHLAETDPLTGLRTRNYLRSHLEQRAPGKQESVLLMDLDHFKSINDTHGHQVGDEVLRCLGRVVQQAIRQTDVAIRYGGEEFLLILTGVAHEDTLHIAERIRCQFQQVAAAEFAALGMRPTLTIGGISEIQSANQLEPFIRQADQNLYEGKRTGRNRLHITRLQTH